MRVTINVPLMRISMTVNGEARAVEVDPAMPLLWVLRDVLDLTGTKYGCGEGQCGACTVHLDGTVAVRACVVPVAALDGKALTTIEGVREHPVQQAWLEQGVPQCGYCQSGQVMQAVALYEQRPRPSREEAETVMSTVLCRCGTAPRIRRALEQLWRAP